MDSQRTHKDSQRTHQRLTLTHSDSQWTHKGLTLTKNSPRSTGRTGPGGPRPRSNNARLHETRTKITQHSGTTTQEHSATQRDHESAVKIQKARTFDRDRRPDGRREGGTDTHKSLRPTLATEESSRARSFARSHARTQRKRKRNRNRFPGSGVGLKSLSHPQPPIHI